MTMVEMKVHMDCSGCENKIRKALCNLKGVETIDIDMGMQKVTVTGYAEAKKVLKAVRRTGKKAEIWPFPYNSEYHPYTEQYYNHNNQNQYYAQSSYNYRKHGYNGSHHGYFHSSSHSTLVDDKASALFSDDNPNACTIM